jgi:hypothetical protein
VEKIENYTRNEWRRSKTTLETSGEDRKPHLKREEILPEINVLESGAQARLHT